MGKRRRCWDRSCASIRTTGDVETFASGFRNIYGLAFDEAGELWGVDNDGRGRGAVRLEELVRIEEGKDYGFPEDGSVGPYTRRTGFPTWIMPAVGSAGISVEDGMVISGSCGHVTRVRLAGDRGAVADQQVAREGCVTGVARLPDGRLVLATGLRHRAVRGHDRGRTLRIMTPARVDGSSSSR